MSDPNLHTQGLISDYFTIEGQLLSTRSSDAHKAIDKSRNAPVCLWTLRYPLAKDSEAVTRFLARLQAIKNLGPTVTEVSAYAVDAAGMAFAVFPTLNGYGIDAGNIEPAEAERRFLAALRIVDQLHQAGIVSGDLCNGSFWIDRESNMRFVGIMGSFDAEAAATSIAPPRDTLNYVAPEQRAGGLEQASDVFALGVLAYRLLTRQYPADGNPAMLGGNFDPDKIKRISDVVGVPPIWAEEVIHKCLAAQPGDRYQNAGAILKAIGDIRQRALADVSSPARPRGAGSLVRSAPGGTTVPTIPTPAPVSRIEDEDEEPKSAISNFRTKILAGLFVVALGVYFIVDSWVANSGQTGTKLQTDLKSHLAAVGGGQLGQAIGVISEKEISLAERAAELEKIVNSDDPIAHDILVKSAKDAKTEQLRALSEKAVIDRARRLGLLRSAEQVRQWLRSLQGEELPASYEGVLQSLDITLPMEARNAALRLAYANSPLMVLKLTAALAIDSEKFTDYQPILAQLMGDSMKFEDAAEYSTLALVLSNPELSVVFGDDVIQRRDQLSDKDVLWLLRILAERNDLNVRAIASVAVERGLLSKLRATFLEIVRDRNDLPPDVLNSLIRAAAGIIKIEDIASFGRWFDVASEKVLLAVLADTNDPLLLTEAFDTLAGKSLSIEPSAALVDWVRRNNWDKRADFAQVIGVLSNLEVLDIADVAKSLGAFDRFVRDNRLLEILLDTKNAQVVRLIVERHADVLGLGGLLNLLRYDDKQVRILAITRLKDYNDLGALKLVIDNYEREKDPEVRQAYRDNFWVIKQRNDAQ